MCVKSNSSQADMFGTSTRRPHKGGFRLTGVIGLVLMYIWLGPQIVKIGLTGYMYIIIIIII